MLMELNQDINNQNRKFTFLCGHDSTIMNVLAALNVEDYELPNAISKKTPIGVKFVIEKLEKDGEEYASLSLVYQTLGQLRGATALDLQNPPMSYKIQLKGLSANADGLYKMADVQERLNSAIAEYDELKALS